MALIVNDNAYLDVATAELYFADRLHTSTWDNATEADKSASLIQATREIESMNFLGSRYDATQKLSFPRSGLVIDGIEVDETTVPQDVKSAVCEYAILMLAEDYTAPDDLSAFDSVSVGSISLTTSKSKKQPPPMVSKLLTKYKDTTLRLVKG